MDLRRSIAAAARRTFSSPPHGPTIWTPTGSPAAVKPIGTDAAGCPVIFQGNVYGHHRQSSSANPSGTSYATGHAAVATTGQTSRSKRLKNARDAAAILIL